MHHKRNKTKNINIDKMCHQNQLSNITMTFYTLEGEKKKSGKHNPTCLLQIFITDDHKESEITENYL